jgi:hypothetical protein
VCAGGGGGGPRSTTASDERAVSRKTRGSRVVRKTEQNRTDRAQQSTVEESEKTERRAGGYDGVDK